MSTPNILILDDVQIIHTAFKYGLEKTGYRVYNAKTLNEASQILSENHIDLVITDLLMPENNGVEICRHIRSLSPDTEIILMSGHPEEVLRHLPDFVAAGGRKEWLRKPFDINEILTLVKKYCGEPSKA